MVPVLRTNGWAPAANGGANTRFDRIFDRVWNDFDQVFEGVTKPTAAALAAWMGMPLAYWADEDRFHVEAEVPGVALDDIDVTVHDGRLYLRVERKPQQDGEEARKYLHNSRSYGRIERVLALPEPVDADRIEATLANGVLRLVLPKSAEAKPRKISIQAG